ncbi:hypothetical protein SAY86_000445 [Trapa natans]|uniref:PPM-type phosphatase domain-containing protein n=1 Tax=Trapa natans TaxID=22666 RepID=A0AAN7MC24_TRANT|nr:hypothetical protein SAY86_000445 [Trapa natans]
MGHLSSMFNGLARSLSVRKGKNFGSACDDRDAAEAMAKEAKKKDFLLCNSGAMNVDGSMNLVSVFSQRGEKGISQDCCIVWEKFGCQTDMIFCGVFDGHGPWGHYVSKRVRKTMPASLLYNWQETLAEASIDPNFSSKFDMKHHWFEVWKRSYFKTCAAVDQELSQHRNINSFYSGTTALSIVRQGDRIVVANVGDSRAVLATTSDDGTLLPVQLTVDFKPNLPGGISEPPPRVRRKVWDVVTNQEAVEIVSSTPDRAKSAKRLVEGAMRAWRRKRPEIAMDDISAICLFFHSSSPSDLQIRADKATV